MPEVAIDILTPKQALLFNEVVKLLERRGIGAHCTTREYYEAEEMLRYLGLKARTIGRHGGAALRGKLEAYSERVKLLAAYYARLKPDLVLSFSSPEAARTAFGLTIPHIAVNDSPHASAVARLTVPLSSILLTPWIIPSKEWERYGIEGRGIIKYRALDPAAWLKGFQPSRKILREVGLDPARPIITIRPQEYLAAYLHGEGVDTAGEIARATAGLLHIRPDMQFVVISRYGNAPRYRRAFGRSVKVTEKVVDGKSLLGLSTLFIGAGGTMTAEAALQGVPTISIYPKSTIVEEYLMRKGLVVKAPKNLYGSLLAQIQRTPRELELQRRRAIDLLNGMVNPAESIAGAIESMLGR
jgi:predicted glycosyltransferase